MRSCLPLLVAISVGCGASASDSGFVDDLDLVPWQEQESAARGHEPGFHASSYHLTWAGKRIGEAREVFQRTDSGVRIVRTERIHITRGGVPVESTSEITIDADENLRATRVELQARAGAVERTGNAVRADDGTWILALDGEPIRRAPENALPIELVPFLAARDESRVVDRPVFLAGFGFAQGHLRMQHSGGRGRVVLDTPWGPLETRLRLGEDGELQRAQSGSIQAIRVSPQSLEDDFTPIELPGLGTIPVSGSGNTLLVHDATGAPPAIAGQSIAMRDGAWLVSFDRARVKTPHSVDAIAREVDRLLAPAHDAPGAGADAALALGRGDCTAHAALFVDLATERGYRARLVTGYRIDGDKLVPHRWATVRLDDTWLQVDPTFREVPVPGNKHLALATHGGATHELALVDEVVFARMGRARVRWTSRSN